MANYNEAVSCQTANVPTAVVANIFITVTNTHVFVVLSPDTHVQLFAHSKVILMDLEENVDVIFYTVDL